MYKSYSTQIGMAKELFVDSSKPKEMIIEKIKKSSLCFIGGGSSFPWWLFTYNKNMHFFISYKFTGEPYNELLQNIGLIESLLEKRGFSSYSSLEDEEWFQKNKPTNKEILFHTIHKMNKSDVVLVFLNSNEKSEGMLIEIGYAIAKAKKIILLVNKEVETTYLRDIAEDVIEFDSITDLESLNFNLEL